MNSTSIDQNSATSQRIREAAEEKTGSLHPNLINGVIERRQSIGDEQEMQDPLSTKNFGPERTESQQSDLSAPSWDLGWYECMIALENKLRFISLSKEDTQEEIPELSNKDDSTDDIDQEDVQDLAFDQLQRQMAVLQGQMMEYQELMQKLAVCMKRNTSLEVEVSVLRASYEKQCQDLVKKMSHRKMRMRQMAQTRTTIERELIKLKLELAQKFTDNDSVECTLEIMITEVDELKKEQKPDCLDSVKRSMQRFFDQLGEKDFGRQVKNANLTGNKTDDDDSVECTLEKMITEADELKKEQKPDRLDSVKRSMQMFFDQLGQKDLGRQVKNTNLTGNNTDDATRRCSYAALSA